MKNLETKIRQIIKEEVGRALEDLPVSGGRFDRMFERGQPGDVFAEAVADELQLTQQEYFEELVEDIKGAVDSFAAKAEKFLADPTRVKLKGTR